MAYGEAEHGCAQGEPCRPGPHEQSARSRTAEPGPPPSPTADSPAQPGPTACRSQIPGWAGAHRHGPVRPALRNVRQERPPRRWC